MHPTIPSTPETADTQLPRPPAAPVILDDTYQETNAAAEREREAAFDSTFAWRGRELLPFSSSRKSLLLQLRLAMGAPDLYTCMKDLDGFLGDAARILFLCSYTPDAPINSKGEGWARLRSDPHALQASMDAWTDTHIPPGTEHAATLLGYQIYSASLINRHEPAPAPRTSADELGN